MVIPDIHEGKPLLETNPGRKETTLPSDTLAKYFPGVFGVSMSDDERP
jgi:uncharacterized protein Veg